MERLLRNVEEVVTREEFLGLRGGVAYLGFEPLWPIHVGGSCGPINLPS